jgi:death on curing protein
MTIYLDLAELLTVASAVLPAGVKVRDAGLLESALARPQGSVFGADAYPTMAEKAAALLHSIARNHALVDGNKRLALAAIVAFLGMNDLRLDLAHDLAFDLVMAAARGEVDVPLIASALAPAITEREA